LDFLIKIVNKTNSKNSNKASMLTNKKKNQMLKSYESTWKSIVQPLSFPYEVSDLGPPLSAHPLQPKLTIEKQELTIQNKYSKTLKASFFHLEKEEPRNKKCVIYCHSHSANRIEGLPLMNFVLPTFNFCLFDFSGCGHSEGEWITMGLKEKDDIFAVVEHLVKEKGQREFYLWGRSMGAVSILMFLEEFLLGERMKDFSELVRVKGVVLDSPFTSVKDTVSSLVTLDC
jgi:pimeloyl-ACP methyl ester carboxylesterase